METNFYSGKDSSWKLLEFPIVNAKSIKCKLESWKRGPSSWRSQKSETLQALQMCKFCKNSHLLKKIKSHWNWPKHFKTQWKPSQWHKVGGLKSVDGSNEDSTSRVSWSSVATSSGVKTCYCCLKLYYHFNPRRGRAWSTAFLKQIPFGATPRGTFAPKHVGQQKTRGYTAQEIPQF